MDRKLINDKLEALIRGFMPVLYQEDDPDYVSGKFGQGVENRELYRYWEWTQGVGLFGLWKLFEKTKDERYLNMLTSYYDERIRSGLPGKNVNTMAPILTIEYLGEYLKNDEYLNIAREWTSWLYEGGLPRTPEGGFQHRTTDDFNEGELWDDTLMMSVLPLANMGRIDGKDEYIEEAYGELKKLSLDEQKRLEYEWREKAIRDYNTQMHSAEKRGERLALKRLVGSKVEKGMSEEVIADLLEIDVKLVMELKEEWKKEQKG